MSTKQLTVSNVNQNVIAAKYAVRGPMLARAHEIASELQEGKKKYPFDQVVFCNVGNPHSLNQKPITFFRRVMSLCTNPELIDMVRDRYPADVIERAQHYLKSLKGGVGAYSNSQGVTAVRQEVASYIERRDGFPAHQDDIYLTGGASQGITRLLQLMMTSPKDGIMIPKPQYPLYSAVLASLGSTIVYYELDESKAWSVSEETLEKSYEQAKAAGINIRGMAVINPGNPAGQCLTEDAVQLIVRFCAKKNLVLLADEVYQDNIYTEVPFTSFKKGLRTLEANGEDLSNLQLASFHSTSKGFIGECGFRGGYVELVGFDKELSAHFYKMAAISLCSNVPGQLMTGLMVSPPKEGDPSFDEYAKERDAILSSLKRRAEYVAETMKKMHNVTCNPVQGALYAFPNIQLPAKAIDAAKKKGQEPDEFYTMALLENVGVCVVPGAGFGQADGTFHFRTTLLPQEDLLRSTMDRFREFNDKFMSDYA